MLINFSLSWQDWPSPNSRLSHFFFTSDSSGDVGNSIIVITMFVFGNITRRCINFFIRCLHLLVLSRR